MWTHPAMGQFVSPVSHDALARGCVHLGSKQMANFTKLDGAWPRTTVPPSVFRHTGVSNLSESLRNKSLRELELRTAII